MKTNVNIRPFAPEDAEQVVTLFNILCQNGDMIYSPLSLGKWKQQFCIPQTYAFTAWDGEALVGFIHGVIPQTFLHGETSQLALAYLTILFVDAAHRRQGIGHALLEALMTCMRELEQKTLVCSGDNPIHLSWQIPNTQGHDHNNAPGVDEACEGYDFLRHEGMTDAFHEISMYRTLSGFTLSADILHKQAALEADGILTGQYNVDWHCEYDQMCDRVGSEYWRNVLRTELAAWELGTPNPEPEFWPDGVCPRGPRPLLTATTQGHIVGFTGPVAKQKSGRGWFTGICTDPAYGGRGIASVLFHLLLAEFASQGASFCTLFTGADNPAQKIYARAGMYVVRKFAVLTLPITPDGMYKQKHF